MDFATRLYSSAPAFVQELLLSAYGVRLRRARYGGVHHREMARLRESQWISADEQWARQRDSLNATLRHAASSVPFYQERGLQARELRDFAEFEAIELLHKDQVRLAGRALIAQQFRSSRLKEIHTGGTTGKPLAIYCDAPTLQRNYAFFERLRVWAGAPDGCRTATFAGRVLMRPDAKSRFWRRNWASNTSLFSSYHISPGTLPAYTDALARWNPELIDSYPSSIEPIARHLLATGDTRIRPRAIITSSETLAPEVRSVIERAFSCRVFDHYGSAEMVAFVTQCEQGSYHVNPEFGYLELVENGRVVGPGETGQIVATGFINPVMPLIRYAMGDWATWADGPCACGRAMPVLREIGGRIDDVIITPDGRRVGRIDPIFKAVTSIFESRVVQDAVDHLRIEIVVEGDLPLAEVETLVQGLQTRVGPLMRIEAIRVPTIPRTSGGKLRMVVNEWARAKSAGGTGPA